MLSTVLWTAATAFASFASAKTHMQVMLPLSTVGIDHNSGHTYLNDYNWVETKFKALAGIGMHGVMSDCWWGLVESKGPKEYDFSGYQEMVRLAQESGLKVQMVLSFHQCGTNVGDECLIPIPQWINRDDIWYKSSSGSTTREYISLFADDIEIQGRTPIEMYEDFMDAFKREVMDKYPGVVEEVQIGAGSAGELRYPSYQLEQDRWSYCGVGEFQSYDDHALEKLRIYGEEQGHSEYCQAGGPNNAGYFKSHPSNDAPFFVGSSFNGYDNYASQYGRFYLEWYANSLLEHGRNLLESARNVYGDETAISMKVAGIHWWYNSNSHGAELTAGYYNTNGNDAYGAIAEMFADYDAIFCFTCLEMRNGADDQCASAPESLVHQTRSAVEKAGGNLRELYAGENALPVHGYDQVDRIVEWARDIRSFTFLRLTDSTNWDYLKEILRGLN